MIQVIAPALPMTGALILASEPPDMTSLAQYGAVGLLASMGAFLSYYFIKRESRGRDKAEERVEQLSNLIMNDFTPLAQQMMQTIAQSTEAMNRFAEAERRRQEREREERRRRASREQENGS